MTTNIETNAKEWEKRFELFVNRAAKSGPFSRALRSRVKEEVDEAMADITWQIKCQIYNRQTSCKHLKGGRSRSRYQFGDYALTTHTFIDSKVRIKCMLCGTEAWSNSGMDFKFRWMASLANESTNRPSASEQVLLQVMRGDKIVDVVPNTQEGRAKLRERFPGWDGKIDGKDLFPEDSVYVIPASDERWVNFPTDHSPIKGVLASTLENAEGIIVTAQDDLLFKEKK